MDGTVFYTGGNPPAVMGLHHSTEPGPVDMQQFRTAFGLKGDQYRMASFILIFLTVYTGMHALVFVRARALLSGHRLAQSLCVLFMVFMVFAPIATRLLEKNGFELSARVAAHLGYAWMGFVFLAFCAFLLTGVVQVLLKMFSRLADTKVMAISGGFSTRLVLGMVVLIWAYGFWEARSIRVERIRITTEKLPAGVESLKIAQISDVHIGLMVRSGRLGSIMDQVASEDPDILVSTGDLVDASFSGTERINGIMSKIHPRLGKYAVTGNHEYHAGLDESMQLTKGMGFTVLRGEWRNVGNVINLVGMDDAAGGSRVDEASLLSSVQNGLFTLLLKHRPQVLPESTGLFDLQLSGHTHRGQIFPFNFITGIVHPLQDGLYELANGSKLYTSRGTGTWGPPVRVLSPPEITIIQLVNGRQSNPSARGAG